MSDLVRVRIDGRDYNVGTAFAQARKLNVLKQPTHNDDGSVRAPSDAPTTPVSKKPRKSRRAAPKSSAGNQPAAKADKPATTAKEAS